MSSSNFRPVFTGAEFKKFIDDPEPWSYQGEPSCFYWDDEMIDVRDLDPETGVLDRVSEKLHRRYLQNMLDIPDSAEVSVSFGFLSWQGKGPAPAVSFEDVVTRWFQSERSTVLKKQLDDALLPIERKQRIRL